MVCGRLYELDLSEPLRLEALVALLEKMNEANTQLGQDEEQVNILLRCRRSRHFTRLTEYIGPVVLIPRARLARHKKTSVPKKQVVLPIDCLLC